MRKHRRWPSASRALTAAARLVPPPRCCRSAVSKVVGAKSAPAVVTLGFIAFWYALNIAFNLQVGAGAGG